MFRRYLETFFPILTSAIGEHGVFGSSSNKMRAETSYNCPDSVRLRPAIALGQERHR